MWCQACDACVMQGHLRAEACAAPRDAAGVPSPEQPQPLDLGRHHQLHHTHSPTQATAGPECAVALPVGPITKPFAPALRPCLASTMQE